ncbi:MAG: tetratricopeptide repeat protein [Gammaproteobacteria bacterium]|nr:tetratricopeptide repeat protein [Gammaproteobacteria bacterium]
MESNTLDSSSTEALLKRARSLAKDSKLEEAASCYMQLTHRDEAPGTLSEYAEILIQLHKTQLAHALLSRCLSLEPENWKHTHRLSILLLQLGKKQEAITLLKRAIDLDTNALAPHLDLMEVLRESGELNAALAISNHSIEQFAANPQSWNCRGKILAMLGQKHQALLCFRKSVELDPDYLGAKTNMGALLCSMKRFEESLAILREVYKRQPDNTLVLHNLALSYMECNELDEAQKLFEILLSNQQLHPETLNNLGMLYQRQGDFVRARDCHNLAIKRGADFTFSTWQRSMALIAIGEYEQGWKDYENRLIIPGKIPLPKTPIPMWSGEDITNRRILLYQEQGLGDQLMFLGCLPPNWLERAEVGLYCDSRLYPLISRKIPNITLLKDDPLESPTAAYDFYLPLGSLPKLSYPYGERLASAGAYIQASPHLVSKWEQKLSTVQGKLKVGISWRGGVYKEQERKSITLDQWAELLRMELPIEWFAIQYDSSREEVEAFNKKTGLNLHILESLQPRQNLDEFSAVLENLDLVIGVSNASIHIAGALNIPSWLLLTKSSATWRWGTHTSTSHWYQSLRIFRNDSNSNPLEVFTQVKKRLLEIVSINQ